MKRMLLLIALAGMVSGVLFAGASGDAGASGSKTIRMWTFLDPAKTDGRSVVLKTVIDNFQAANPGVKVEVEPQSWNILSSKFLAAAASKSAPDVIWNIHDDMGGVLDANVLEPFENLFLKNWSAADIEDIHDAQWDFAVRNGKHYQVTLSKSIMLIWYREDLFKQYGISIPKTWDELFAAAKKLTGVDPATGIMRYGLGQTFTTENTDPPIMTNMILERQGTLFDAQGKANWTTDVGKQALQAMVDCIKSGITPASALTTTADDMFLEFAAGKYAMIMAGAVRVSTVRTSASFDPKTIQLMLFPSYDGKKNAPAVTSGWAVGVWAGSSNKELAGKFVEAMISPESDKLWVQTGGQVPIRKSTGTALASYLSDPINAYLKVMSEGMKSGWSQPTNFSIMGYKFDLNQAIQNVVVQNMSLDAALSATAAQFNSRNGK
jgi:multiple sugar transport system substrate-binding protein